MADDQTPLQTFDLLSFLTGTSTAHGVFEDRAGRVRRSYRIDIVGRRDGGRLIMDEVFQFDDGAYDERTWVLSAPVAGSFIATATDVLGTAQGTVGRTVTEMRYKFRLRLRERSIVVDMHDRFYAVGATTMINRSTVRKFGIRLGELTTVFERVGHNARRALPQRDGYELAPTA
jgi:hypothetical protein